MVRSHLQQPTINGWQHTRMHCKGREIRLTAHQVACCCLARGRVAGVVICCAAPSSDPHPCQQPIQQQPQVPGRHHLAAITALLSLNPSTHASYVHDVQHSSHILAAAAQAAPFIVRSLLGQQPKQVRTQRLHLSHNAVSHPACHAFIPATVVPGEAWKSPRQHGQCQLLTACRKQFAPQLHTVL